MRNPWGPLGRNSTVVFTDWILLSFTSLMLVFFLFVLFSRSWYYWASLLNNIQCCFSPRTTITTRGSPIGLAECGMWLFFAVIFRICKGGKWELQLRAGAGFRVFIGLGCRIRKGNRAGYGVSILTWPHKLLLTSAKTTSWQKRAYSCVRLF